MKVGPSDQAAPAQPTILLANPVSPRKPAAPSERSGLTCALTPVDSAAVQSATQTLAPCGAGQVEPYRAIADALRSTARTNFSQGLVALEALGASERQDPQRLVDAFAFVLRRARLDGGAAERVTVSRVLALLGVDDWDQPWRITQVHRVIAALGDPPDLRRASYETTLVTRYLLQHGSRTRVRWQARVAELSQPSTQRPHEALFLTLNEFPNLASVAYQALQLEGIEEFPPRPRARVAMNARAERFVRHLGEWQATQRTAARVESGLMLGGAIVVGILGSFAAGPVVGALGATVVGTGGASVRAAREHGSYLRAQDAFRLGLGSAEAVQLRADDLEGARGAVLVSVATAGIAARLGVTSVSGSFVRRLLAQQGRSLAIGTGAGAAIALVHPGIWKSSETIGVVVEGALWGAVTGVVGGTFGALSGASARVAIMFFSKPAIPIGNEPVRIRLESGREVSGRVVSLIPQLGILTAKADDGSTVQVRIESLTTVQAPIPKVDAAVRADVPVADDRGTKAGPTMRGGCKPLRRRLPRKRRSPRRVRGRVRRIVRPRRRTSPRRAGPTPPRPKHC